MDNNTLRDRIRGSLIGGAIGDALGYPVEFISRQSILAQYGKNGITKFDLSSGGKALISDDTQMTLFTACGMLMGVNVAICEASAESRRNMWMERIWTGTIRRQARKSRC